MEHGTPSSLDEMPEYLRLVRGGRPPSDELIHEMRENYAAIGGRSPLTDITEAQAAALRARLGPEIPVAAGMRNWQPFIKDALAELAAAGVTRTIGIPMAPQFSTLSVQKYIDAATGALPPGMQFESVNPFTRTRCCSTRSPSASPLRNRNPTSSWSSPPTVCRSASSPQAIAMPTKSRRQRAAWRLAPASTVTSVPIRAPAERRSRGSVRRSTS